MKIFSKPGMFSLFALRTELFDSLLAPNCTSVLLYIQKYRSWSVRKVGRKSGMGRLNDPAFLKVGMMDYEFCYKLCIVNSNNCWPVSVLQIFILT